MKNKIDKLIAKHCPKGVRFFTLGEVFETSSGGTPRAGREEYYKNGHIPWVRSGEVDGKFITDTEIKITQKGLEASSAKLFPPNSVLVAMYGATAAKVGMLGIEATTNQAVCALLPNKNCLPKYAYYFLHSQEQKLKELSAGGAQPNISQTIIKNYKIPVPPVAVQKEIVKILDSYTECAAELVAQLKAEITARGQEYSYHRNALLGFDPSAIKNHPLKNLINQHCPKGVRFFELGEVCEVNSKSDDPKNLFKDEFIYIDISSVESKTGKIDLTHKLSLKKYPSRARRVFKKGDILMSSVRPNLQSFAYVDFDVTNHIASTGFLVLSPDIKLLNSKFLYRMLFSENMQSQMILKMGKGGYPSINQKDAFQLKIPVPPVAVQKEIVKILDSYTQCEAELVAQLEAEITARRSQYEYCRNKLLTFEESYGV